VPYLHPRGKGKRRETRDTSGRRGAGHGAVSQYRKGEVERGRNSKKEGRKGRVRKSRGRREARRTHIRIATVATSMG
jgi:hypothetical protein